MGEARRRAQAGRISGQMLDAMAERSVGDTTGRDGAQALVMDIARESEVRAALGGLPLLVEQSLDAVKRLPSDKGGNAKAVVWLHWPGGRQWAKLARSVAELRDLGSRELMQDASVRGHGLRVAAFPDEGWRDVVERLASEQAAATPSEADIAAAARLVRRDDDSHGVVVARTDDAAARRAVAATLLRSFDALVADADAFAASRGTVFIDFEGHDDDPREFWDIEGCAELLRTLDRHAPWWPWLVEPAQNFAWLGALLATGPTRVNQDMEVAFPFEADKFKALLQRTVSACAQAAFAVGLDLRTSGDLRSGLEEIRNGLMETGGIVTERWERMR